MAAGRKPRISDEDVALAQRFLQSLFSNLSYDVSVEAAVSDDLLAINVTGPDAAAIAHRENGRPDHAFIQALRHLVHQVCFGQRDRLVPMTIDVADYRQLRQASLEAVAESLAGFATPGSTLKVHGINALDRKVVHNRLGDIEDIKSRSDGGGVFRHLIIER